MNRRFFLAWVAVTLTAYPLIAFAAKFVEIMRFDIGEGISQLGFTDDFTIVSYDAASRPDKFTADALRNGVLRDGRSDIPESDKTIYTIMNDVVNKDRNHIEIATRVDLPMPIQLCDDEKNYLDGMLPPLTVPIKLADDLTGELAARLFSEAYIVPLISLDESHEIEFHENVEAGDARAISNEHRIIDSSESRWTAYIVSAYQGSATEDGDPGIENLSNPWYNI